MQLTPKPVTAEWQPFDQDLTVLRILNYDAQVYEHDMDDFEWSITYTDPATGRVKGLNGDFAPTFESAKEAAETIIRMHHEGGDA